mmetsp:Transcript_54467/g.109551  ORF Transcript_54467/g.109551 Transcript_54467/m.109551 type:complete len:452 (-) Transcript_54467:273-1628(-)
MKQLLNSLQIEAPLKISCATSMRCTKYVDDLEIWRARSFPRSSLIAAVSVAVSAVSIVGMFHFLAMATTEFDLSKYPSPSDKSMMTRMHKQGQIPPQIMLYLLLPSVATTAGMKLNMSKTVSLFNLIVFVATVIAIYSNIVIEFELCSAEACEDDIFRDFKQDLIASSMMFFFGLFLTHSVIESERAERQATFTLNHVVKNKVAGAAAAIEIFIHDHPTAKRELQPSCEQLQQMFSLRQTETDLSDGAYTTTLTPETIHGVLNGVDAPTNASLVSDNTRKANDHSGSSDIIPNLRVCCLDDSNIICKGYKRLLLPLMRADLQSSMATCPTSPEDTESFIEAVLGNIDTKSAGVCAGDVKSSEKPADIIILDQNIDFDDKKSILGTDIAMTLKARGFGGLVMLRTGNTSVDDKKMYFATSAVDACLGKEGGHKKLACRIFKEYRLKSHLFPA